MKTKEGFSRIIHCGEDVESIRITVYGKTRAFRKQKVDNYQFTKGAYPLRITLEDSQPETQQEKYKLLKEKAILDQDFELASKYRDLEKKGKNGKMHL